MILPNAQTLREILEIVAAERGITLNPEMLDAISEMEVQERRCKRSTIRTCPCEDLDKMIKDWGYCMASVLITFDQLRKREKQTIMMRERLAKGLPIFRPIKRTVLEDEYHEDFHEG